MKKELKYVTAIAVIGGGIIIGFKVLMYYVDENLPISSEDDWI